MPAGPLRPAVGKEDAMTGRPFRLGACGVLATVAVTLAGVPVPTEGWTWQEFTTDMEKVGAATGTAGTTDFGWAVDWFDSWLHTRGKQLYTADGQLGFTADDLTAFWTMTGEMRDKKGVSAAQATTKMDGSMQNSALVTGATLGLPANLDVRSQVCASAEPGNKAVCDYETTVKAKIGPSSGWLWPSGSSAIKTDFQKVYDDVIFGKKSPAAAAAQVVSDAQQSLKS